MASTKPLPAQIPDDDDLLVSLARDKEQEVKTNAKPGEEEDLLLSLEKEQRKDKKQGQAQGQKDQEIKLKDNNKSNGSNNEVSNKDPIADFAGDDEDLTNELKKEMSTKTTAPKIKKTKTNKVQSTKVVPIQRSSSEVNSDDDDNFDSDNETDDPVCGDYAIMVQNGIVWIIQPGHPPEERGRANENDTLTIKLNCPHPKEKPDQKQVVYSCQGEIMYITNFIDKSKQWPRPKGAFAVLGGGQSSAVKNLKWLVSRRSYSTDGTVRVEEKKKKMSFPTRAFVVVSTNGKQSTIIGRKEGADDDDTLSSVQSKKMSVSFDGHLVPKKDEVVGITFQYCRSNEGDEQKVVAGLSSFENPGKDVNLVV